MKKQFLWLAATSLVAAGLVLALRNPHSVPGAAASDEPARTMTTVELVRHARPSIVRLDVIDATDREVEAGTGFVIDGKQGYLLTNWHVVTGDGRLINAQVRATFQGMQARVAAQIVGVDSLADLAVLKVDLKAITNKELLTPEGHLRALKFADPARIQVGEDVVAIGFPYALSRGLDGEPSVTRGVVSVLNRSLGMNSGLIQTDTAVNPGNSGGPLMNLRGEVVGVNTYRGDQQGALPIANLWQALGRVLLYGEQATRYTQSVNLQMNIAEGLNFARSCATAAPFAERLIKDGQLKRASLGLTLADMITLPRALARNYVLDSSGVMLSRVEIGSPAQKAGMKRFDVIVEMTPVAAGAQKSWRIRSIGDVENALVFLKSGQQVKVRLLRPAASAVEAVQKHETIAPFMRVMDQLETQALTVTVTLQ